ncbi:fibronectin type III domain-containing protein [Paenibacillus sp. MMO-177]|uniref:fibronectin type III domain-containing protein n=1 Tax=Paenibacillus sp. MMO-177 TaxID=3081289 RepID=UPI0030167B7E
MILKPSNIAPENLTFPAGEELEITWKNNGDLMRSFIIEFKDIANGSIVYKTNQIQGYITKYTVPPYSLIDGREYTYTVKVFNANGDSAISNPTVLRFNTRPRMSVLNDGYIRNQTATVIGTYSQDQLLELKAYKFVLYDEFKHVLEQSDYLYDGLLEYTFKYILEDGKEYFVECIGVTQNDLLGTSGLISVIADYIPPTVYFNLGADTFIDKPYVRLTWTTVRIIGHGNGHVFTDDGKVDVRDGLVYFDDGFNIESDFTIKLWAEDVSKDVELVRIKGGAVEITVEVQGTKIVAIKKSANMDIESRVASDIIGDINTGQLFIVLQQIGMNLNITCEVK